MEPAVILDWTDGLSVIAPTARTVGEVSFPHFFIPFHISFPVHVECAIFSCQYFSKIFLTLFSHSFLFLFFALFFFKLNMRMSTNDSSLRQLDSPHKYLLLVCNPLFYAVCHPGASNASVICWRARLGAPHSQRLLCSRLPSCHGCRYKAWHHQFRLQSNRLSKHRER